MSANFSILTNTSYPSNPWFPKQRRSRTNPAFLAMVVSALCLLVNTQANAYGFGSFPGSYGYEGPAGGMAWQSQQNLELSRQQRMMDDNAANNRMFNNHISNSQAEPKPANQNPVSNQPAPAQWPANAPISRTEVETAIAASHQIIGLGTGIYYFMEHCKAIGYPDNNHLLTQWSLANHWNDASAVYRIMEKKQDSFAQETTNLAQYFYKSLAEQTQGSKNMFCDELETVVKHERFNTYRNNTSSITAMRKFTVTFDKPS